MNAPESLAGLIDHTLLKPTASSVEIRRLCEEAKRYGFASVCVNGCFVPMVRSELDGSGVRTCSVAGFPLGASHPRAKAAETRALIEAGADEIDMVIDTGGVLEGDWERVKDDIRGVVDAAAGRLVKVILEVCLLTPDQIELACRTSVAAGASFVKTSTGFSTGGATLEAVRLMRQTVGPHIGVKASGGIRDRATALRMVEAGAGRLGTSSGVAIVEGAHSP